jgi:site-specific recombinase XerD
MVDQAQSLPLLDLVPSWVRHARSKRLSERTIYLYSSAATRLSTWLEARGEPTNVGSISRPTLEDYFIAMRADVGDYTVAIHYRSLRALFNWLEREEEVERSPFARMSELEGRRAAGPGVHR